MKMGIDPWTENSKFISSEKRKYFDNVRGDCDIFCRGLIDGYRLEQERLHRMMKEKDDEKKIDRKVKNMMKEWEKNIRSGIEKEIQEEIKTEFNLLKMKIDEERNEFKTFMEDMKKEKNTYM